MGIKKFDGISEEYCAGNYESYDEETAGSDSVRRSLVMLHEYTG
jgi:hypothetical protein